MPSPIPTNHATTPNRLRGVVVERRYADPGDAEARARVVSGLARLLSWQPPADNKAAGDEPAAVEVPRELDTRTPDL